MWVKRTPSLNNNNKEVKENTTKEPKAPPIVGSGSPTRKNHINPYDKQNNQQNKKVNKKPSQTKKTAFEILMEEN